MMIFIGLAVLFFLRYKNNGYLFLLILSGLMVFLGVMTKGLVALFVWSAPFWLLICQKQYRFKSFIWETLILILSTLIPLLLLLWLNEDAYQYWSAYMDRQVIHSINNVQTVDHRFWIMLKMGQEIITPSLIILLLWGLTYKSKPDQHHDSGKALLVNFSKLFRNTTHHDQFKAKWILYYCNSAFFSFRSGSPGQAPCGSIIPKIQILQMGTLFIWRTHYDSLYCWNFN